MQQNFCLTLVAEQGKYGRFKFVINKARFKQVLLTSFLLKLRAPNQFNLIR